MVIRVILTIIFLLIGIYSYKKSIIIEKEKNPKLIKNSKLNLLTSAIPYTLSKIFFVYAICLIGIVTFLQSYCNKEKIIEKYEITSVNEEYVSNTRKNQTYIFDTKEGQIKIKGIDEINIIEESGELYVEKYQLISDKNIINILMYGSYEDGLNIYK